ncbi:50S ribosome-binding GTPase [Anaerobacillus sp. HL2]|nr:50S ribosome-binding GTPase [Anaerobacillus sp. HL2]
MGGKYYEYCGEYESKALAGNPNSGKTTLFNALTGRTERVGNWAGVTVDKKEGDIKEILIRQMSRLQPSRPSRSIF